MDLIKNREKVLNSVNELIDVYGNPKELAENVDELIFIWITTFMRNGECGCKMYAEQLSQAKAIRDFFLEIETIR